MGKGESKKQYNLLQTAIPQYKSQHNFNEPEYK